MAACAGCGLAILDRYVLNVVDRSWHAECLRCSQCGTQLQESCFSRDGRLLCKDDFTRLYVSRCAGCGGTLEKDDLVRRARDKVFHVDCFTCTACGKKLDTGEQLYMMNESRFLCSADFSAVSSPLLSTATPFLLAAPSSSVVLPPMSSESDVTSEVEDDSVNGRENASSPSEGSTSRALNSMAEDRDDDGEKGSDDANSAKRRGPRTTIKAKQLETLKNAFATTPKPTRHIREQLAQETGLNMRVIQVWFQNRRSKERRMKQLRFGGTFRGARRNRNGREDSIGDAALFSPDGSGGGGGYFAPPLFYCDVYPPQGGDLAMGVPPPPPIPPVVSTSLLSFDSSPLSQQTLLLSSECHDDSSSMSVLYPPQMKHQNPPVGW